MDQLKSFKSIKILNTLSPLDPEVQRYLSLKNKIEQLMENAEDEDDECIPMQLLADLFVLQEKLYLKALEKDKEVN